VSRRVRITVAALALALTVQLTGCAGEAPDAIPYREVARHPHDTGAFTQGLLWHDGALYESTGLYGASSLRRVDLESGEVLAVRYLADDRFAEGLARVGDELIQLTWRAQEAYRWPLAGFERGDPALATYAYDGEGWGLCFDGERLVMSDGSARLTFRDPEAFTPLGSVDVTLDGEPLARLNELECIGDQVWANVWYDDRVVRIDPDDGRVTGVLDASSLLSPEERAGLSPEAVLNGIAWRPESGTLLLTGKLWPVIVELAIDDAAP
jgi:glutaminyl-peptide cyclotransferase